MHMPYIKEGAEIRIIALQSKQSLFFLWCTGGGILSIFVLMPPESPYMVGTAAGLRLGRAYARQASLRVLRQSLCLAGFTVCA